MECHKKRRQTAQQRWTEKNPGYFKGRSDVVREWRSRHPDYQRTWRAQRREIQDEIPCKSSMITIHLAIVDEDLKVEIQDKIRQQKALGVGFLVAGRAREIQDEIAPQTMMAHTPP